MKKIFFALVALTFVFASCDPDESTINYVGTYEGIYTFGSNDSTKEGVIPVVDNPFGNGLLLYSILPFDTTDTVGLFRANSDIVPTMVAVLNYIGVDLGEDIDSIKNMDATATFGDNTLKLKLSYSFEVLESEIGVNLIQFEGTKVSDTVKVEQQ